MRPRGIALIEILIALAVLAIIAAGGVRVAMKHIAQVRIEESNAKLDVIRTALEGYYRRHCGAGLNPTPTVAALVGEGLLESTAFARHPLGSDYTVAIAWGIPTVLSVSTVANTPAHVTSLSATLFESTVSGSTVRWSWVAGTLDDYADDEARLYLSMYQAGCR